MAENVTLTLTLEETNRILAVLQDQPYRTVASLIAKIIGQAQSAMAAEPETPPAAQENVPDATPG